MALVSPYTSIQSDSDVGLTFTSLHYSATLAASTDTVLIVPGSAPSYKILVKVSTPNDDTVFFAVNEIAEDPAGATFAQTTSEIANEYDTLIREVKAGDELHFFGTGAGIYVSVSFYKIV